MKRDKRLIVLKNSTTIAGSVSFLRDGTKCLARFSFLKKESGTVVVFAGKENSLELLDSTSAVLSFECDEGVIPYFYLVTKTEVISGSWDGRAGLKNKEIEIKYAPKTQFEKNENKTVAPCEDDCNDTKIATDYDDEEVVESNYYPSNLRCIIDEQNEDGECAMTTEIKTKSLRNFSVKPQAKDGMEKVRFTVGRRANFFEKAQPKIELLFKKFERFEVLEKLLPESKWVKIPYDSNGRFYAVGVVGSKPEYVCYAVPDVYKACPPCAFEDVGVWIMSEPKKENGAGFWVIFQGCCEGKLSRMP